LLELFVSNSSVYEKYVSLIREDGSITRISVWNTREGWGAYPTTIGSLTSESEIIKDFSKKMKVELVKVNSYKPLEIEFFVYSFGFSKGIFYSESPEAVPTVSSLDLYGTKKSPRVKTGGKPDVVYRSLSENWFLFAD